MRSTNYEARYVFLSTFLLPPNLISCCPVFTSPNVTSSKCRTNSACVRESVPVRLVLLSCDRETKEIPAVVFGASSDNTDESKEFHSKYMERKFSEMGLKASGDLLVFLL
jgi:hypothetical protein